VTDGTTSISSRVEGEVSIIAIKGDVTAAIAASLEETYAHLSGGGATKLLLCFEHNAYINSGGIAVLIGIVSEAGRKGQTVRMTGLSAHFQKIFAMVGLTRYAKIFPTEAAAVKGF
jgi:anti-anti-sigma factor